MKTSYAIPLAIVFGGIIVAGAVYLSTPKSPKIEGIDPTLVRLVDSSDHIFGNPAAKVTIVEYSDFDCAYCKTFHETMHQVMASEGTDGQVAWVFRQFPLTEIHPNALSHARAAECAAATSGNEMFWKFADALYANQPISPENYGTIAATAGISGNAFATCYAAASSTITARIMNDRKNALDMGASGTPFSLLIVAGKTPIVMAGSYPYEAIRQLIDEALAK